MTLRIDDILYSDRRDAEQVSQLAHANARLQLAEQLRLRFDLRLRPLGELLPGLATAAEPGPPFREVSVRVSNVLRRAQISTWSRLASCTILGIDELPNCGTKSVVEILATAILGWSEASPSTADVDVPADHPPAMTGSVGSRADVAPGSPEPRWSVPPRQLEAAAELEDLLRSVWATTGAETIEEALNDMASYRVPASVRRRASALRELRLDELLDLPPVNEETWRRFLEMSEREGRILKKRIYAPPASRATLEELGSSLDVTRERVRQLEGAVLERLEKRLEEPDGSAIRHLAGRATREIGQVATPSAVDGILTHLVETTSESGTTQVELRKAVLRKLCGPPVNVGGLACSAGARILLEDLERRYAGSEPTETLDRTALDATLDDLAVDERLREQILTHLGLRDRDGTLIVWRGSMADLAVSCLAAHARPMSMDELHGELGYDRNPRSLTGQVQTDARIIRLGKDSYGLRRWGGDEYTGILDGIERAIVEGAGAVNEGDLIAGLAARFGVSENSVRAYAKDRRFVRRADGTVALRTADDPEVAITARPVELARGVIRLDGVWHVRIVVDPEVLRGSGRPIARSVALESGIEPDLTLGFEYNGGTILFSWGAIQPSLGSVRSVALAQSCVESDLLFIPLDGPEPRPVRVVRSATVNGEHGCRRLAIELGLDPASVSDDDPVVVAVALGLPAGADWEDVRERLADRGEVDLAMHVPAVWE